MLKKILYGFIILLVLALVAFFVLFFRLSGQSELLVNAGLQNNLLQDCPDRPSCVSSLATVEEHAIAAFNVPPGFSDPVAAMADLIMSMPRAEILELNDDYLHATFHSAFFGFVDDFEILKDSASLQVRSVSRVGFSDMGVNRERVEKLRILWEQELAQDRVED